MRKPGNETKKEIIIFYIMFGIPFILYRLIVGDAVLDGIFLWVVIFFCLFYPWYRGAKNGDKKRS